MKLLHRILLVILPIIVVLFAAAGFTLNYFSKQREVEGAIHKAQVYVNRLLDLVDIVEAETGNGFTPDDIYSLQKYFANPAYYSSDFPFIFSTDGRYLLHPLLQGQRMPIEVIKQLKAERSKEGVITYSDYAGQDTEKRILCYKFYKPYNAYLALSLSENEVFAALRKSRNILIVAIMMAILITLLSFTFLLRPIIRSINLVNIKLRQLSKGELPNKLSVPGIKELAHMVNSLNQLIEGLRRTTRFARNIEQNKLDVDFTPLSPKDELGNALIEMRESLKHALREEEKRKEEERIRSWTNEGVARFSEILRQNNNDLNKLSDTIIQNLVTYIDANQGGVFLQNETDEGVQLNLLSAFAYNRKKFLEKTIREGEGLVGTCALEKQTIYLKEIPEDYITITSGLGEATPTSLLVVPLKLEDEIFGVLELASFREFQPYEIEFVEKIAQSIASTLFSVKNSIRTRMLLEQSQQQREEMAAQEEEMRQNMEEMQATQEEMHRKQAELETVTNAIDQSLLSLTLNADGYISSSNTIFHELTGYTKSETEERRIHELIHDEHQEYFSGLWEKVVSGQPVNETFRLVGNHNRDIYVMASLSPGIDSMGNIERILFIGQDVTESKKLELMAQEQAEQLEMSLIELQNEQELSARQKRDMETLLEALDQNCLVSIMEPDGLITYINRMNVEVLGDSKEDIEGKYLQDIDFTAKTKPKEFKTFWNNLLKGKKQRREFSLTVNGKVKWVAENFTPIMDDTGSLYKVINIGFDITDSKAAEEALSKKIDELRKQLKK